MNVIRLIGCGFALAWIASACAISDVQGQRVTPAAGEAQ